MINIVIGIDLRTQRNTISISTCGNKLGKNWGQRLDDIEYGRHLGCISGTMTKVEVIGLRDFLNEILEDKK
jgi:hypothetical protein